MNQKKLNAYREQIKRSISEIYDHMTNDLLGWMPDDQMMDVNTFTAEQEESILNVQAIESEWILNPELREEISLIQLSDQP